MKVGMYYSNSDVRVEEQPVPVVGDTDILIKVMASGICGSDLLEWYRIQRAPLVLGHELAGEIVEVGTSITTFKPGDRVFATHHVPCDECRYCLGGHETACKTFQTENNFLPGGFAQFLKVGGRSIITGTMKLADNMSYDAGTFVEPLGTAVRGIRTIDLQPTDSIMIFGSGIAGILLMKLARARGAKTIIACDIDDSRLRSAKKAGADFTVSAKDDVIEFIKQNNGGRLADKVLICAGALSAAETALQCVDKGGMVLFFAVPKPGESLAVDFNPYWRDDISIKTCYGAAPRDNSKALELLASDTIDVSDMITHRFPIDDIGEAFKTAANPNETLKVIVEPNREG